MSVAVARAPVEENILPRHMALVMAQGLQFSIYFFIFSSEFFFFFFLVFCVFVIERVVVSNYAGGS